LEVLQREDKAAMQKLSSLEEKYQEHDDKKTSLEEEATKLGDRKEEASFLTAQLSLELIIRSA
jgi:hypothetical protein